MSIKDHVEFSWTYRCYICKSVGIEDYRMATAKKDFTKILSKLERNGWQEVVLIQRSTVKGIDLTGRVYLDEVRFHAINRLICKGCHDNQFRLPPPGFLGSTKVCENCNAALLLGTEYHVCLVMGSCVKCRSYLGVGKCGYCKINPITINKQACCSCYKIYHHNTIDFYTIGDK